MNNRGYAYKVVSFGTGDGDTYGTVKTVLTRAATIKSITCISAAGVAVMAMSKDTASEQSYFNWAIGGIVRVGSPAALDIHLPEGLKAYGTANTSWLVVYEGH